MKILSSSCYEEISALTELGANLSTRTQRYYNLKMLRNLRHSIPPSLRAIETASRRPTLCFVVRDDENKTGGMIVREKNFPAEVGKTQTSPRSASEVIAEMAEKQNAIIRKNQLSVEKRGPRYKTLHEAAKNDCAESIAILVRRGADVNGHESIEYGHATGYTALGMAASCNSLNAIAELIKHKADVNAYGKVSLSRSWMIDPADGSRGPEQHAWLKRPILSCAYTSETIAMLIKYGADIEAQDSTYGRTPLLHAVSNLISEWVAHYLECGANADAQDDSGTTAFALLESTLGGRLYDGGGDEEIEHSIWSDYRDILASLEKYSKKPLSADEMFKRGENWVGGMLPNHECAAKWFRRAAKQGHVEAQNWVYTLDEELRNDNDE